MDSPFSSRCLGFGFDFHLLEALRGLLRLSFVGFLLGPAPHETPVEREVPWCRVAAQFAGVPAIAFLLPAGPLFVHHCLAWGVSLPASNVFANVPFVVCVVLFLSRG